MFEDAVDQYAAPPRIVGSLVTTDDVVLHLFFIATQPVSKRNIALATNGDTVFTAWQTPKDSPADVYAKVLTRFGDIVAGGTPEDVGMRINTSSGDHSDPAVVWNRASLSYIVAWQSSGDIVVRRFTATGAPIDAAPQIVSGLSHDESRPVLVPFGSAAAAVYSRDADEPAYGGVGRFFVRLVGIPKRARAVR